MIGRISSSSERELDMCLIYIIFYAFAIFIILSGLVISVGLGFMEKNWFFVVIGLMSAYFGYWLLKQLPRP